MQFQIPIRLPSLANGQGRVGWRKVARMKKDQRAAVALVLADRRTPPLPPLPAIVTITRVGPRRLDDDNLAAACKYVRDAVAAAYGEDDGGPLYEWRYAQQIGTYAVEVEVISREE